MAFRLRSVGIENAQRRAIDRGANAKSFSLMALGLALSLLTLPGCGASGPTTYPVKGVVRFTDGKPVRFGEIEFQSLEQFQGQPWNARGKIARDGSFTVETRGAGNGAVEGKHKVVIHQVVVDYYNLNVVHDHGALIDRKYSDYGTTDLEVEVTRNGEANQFELQVVKQPGSGTSSSHH